MLNWHHPNSVFDARAVVSEIEFFLTARNQVLSLIRTKSLLSTGACCGTVKKKVQNSTPQPYLCGHIGSTDVLRCAQHSILAVVNETPQSLSTDRRVIAQRARAAAAAAAATAVTTAAVRRARATRRIGTGPHGLHEGVRLALQRPGVGAGARRAVLGCVVLLHVPRVPDVLL